MKNTTPKIDSSKRKIWSLGIGTSISHFFATHKNTTEFLGRIESYVWTHWLPVVHWIRSHWVFVWANWRGPADAGKEIVPCLLLCVPSSVRCLSYDLLCVLRFSTIKGKFFIKRERGAEDEKLIRRKRNRKKRTTDNCPPMSGRVPQYDHIFCAIIILRTAI